MKLGGVAAVGGSLLGYAGAAAIQEQVIQVPFQVFLLQPSSCSNQPGTTLTRTTRPSPRSLSLRHARMLQLPRQLREESSSRTGGRQGAVEEALQGAGEEASCHLAIFGSVVGALSRFAGRGGRGVEGREEMGAVSGRRRMGAGKKTGVEGERGQGTCLAGKTEQRRCDGSKLNLSHIHTLDAIFLICQSLNLYICGALLGSSSSHC